ncbi:MAG: glycosyltransferase, partial [Oscillospiraceae bacterium]|nr:glycosyltransferase [Oscillospiraceae bacterium]
RAAAQLRKLMKQERYDLIICHTSLAAFFTRLAILGIKKETRLVNVVHGYLFDDRSPWYKSAILKSAEYLVASVTDLVLTMNEWDHQWAKNHKVAAKVGVIPGMGLGPEKMKKAVHSNCFEFKDGDFLLIYPAEFSERKNQAMLIRAMTKLPENIRLILPGDGLLKEECMEFAHELGLEKRVHFPGYVKDIFQLMSYSDIAVSSSRSEGLPFNLLEAMSMGLPLVASRVKGNSDLIEDGENGFLFEYDDVDGFVSCITQLTLSEEKRRTMGEINVFRVENFTLDNVLPVVMEQYLNEDI